MNILFHAEQISERGTSTAIYEYASYLRSKGYNCVIAFDRNHPVNDQSTILQLSKKFELRPYNRFSEVKKLEANLDFAYFIKAGFNDGIILKNIPTMVHAVFQEYDPHGTLYVYVSEWLAKFMQSKQFEKRHRHILCRTVNCKDFEFLNHGVTLPKPNSSIRDLLNIPEEANLGIRYGGFDTFDIDWVQEAVSDILEHDKLSYFVFVNTKEFIENPRVKFLPKIVDLQTKSNFLASGDYFLHGRRQGESFGLAILESISVGTPTLGYFGGQDLNHHNLIPYPLLYKNKNTLIELVINSQFKNYTDEILRISRKYTREKVGADFESYMIRAIECF